MNRRAFLAGIVAVTASPKLAPLAPAYVWKTTGAPVITLPSLQPGIVLTLLVNGRPAQTFRAGDALSVRLT